MSAQPSSFVPAFPPHVFVHNRDERRVKHNHQQLQHAINRILTHLEVSDKAARGVTGIHGVLNGREKFPAYIAHKWTARQLSFRGKDENTDQFMCRVLTAISDAEKKCGRKFFQISRADGVTQIITSYECDYIGEVALWALTEAKKSEAWKKNPAQAITDELVERAIAKLPECEIVPPVGDGESDIENVVKSMWTRIENNAEANIMRSVDAGINPLIALENISKRLRRLAVSALRKEEDRYRCKRAMNMGEDFKDDDFAAHGDDDDGSGKNISDKTTPPRRP
jgi:hypothetical protein